jgi:3'-phosphoadenosine 5'-phosphosulfate sulfotransferase (PAPS reductase)/FAD synthetase
VDTNTERNFNMNIINFSGGKTSAYMTRRLLDEGIKDYIVTFQNTGKESPETLDFINECDKRWGLNIVWLEYRSRKSFEVVSYDTASRNGEPFEQLIKDENALPNSFMRFCTKEMKINTMKRYFKSIGIKEWDHYVGIRYDEPRRWGKTSFLPKFMTVIHPLVEWKVTSEDVNDFWSNQDFGLKLSQPFGNCDCCFLKGKGKLAELSKMSPESFSWWKKMEKDMGFTFRREASYELIEERAKQQLDIWSGDPSFDCFCNVE